MTPPESAVPIPCLWDALPAALRDDVDGALALRCREIAAQWWAPRDFGACGRFLMKETAGADRLVIYGAGTHTARLLTEVFAATPGRVVAIVDQRAAGIGAFHGLPVIAPDQLSGLSFDRLIVAHPVDEPAMIAAALAHGTPEAAITAVYSQRAFQDTVMAEEMARADEALKAIDRPVRHVIIASAKWAIIQDDELARALPPEETLKLHYDPVDPFRPGAVYPTIDTRASLGVVRHILAQIRPETVFTRVYVQTAPLAPLVRDWVPSARHIHEMYDFAGLLGDGMLRDWMGLSRTRIETSLLAELSAARHADLVISKRAPDFWPPDRRPNPAPYALYHGGVLGPSPSPSPARDGVIRLLYAGIIPRWIHLPAHPGDYDFLPVLEQIAAMGGFRVDLYNYLHDGEAADPSFQEYRDRYQSGPVRYHRCVDQATLLERAAGADLGWLYRPGVAQGAMDARLVIGQRLTGYVRAGLPVILDEGWGAMADLVKQHGAGLVVPRGATPETLATLIKHADFDAARAGVRALREQMIVDNLATLDMISRLGDTG